MPAPPNLAAPPLSAGDPAQTPYSHCPPLRAGDPAIEATVKVSPGFLFPLPSAFCFVERPQIFLSHSDIRCYELLRRGATFDLHLYPKPGSTGAAGGAKAAPLEFSQLDLAELGRLISYLERSKLKVRTRCTCV